MKVYTKELQLTLHDIKCDICGQSCKREMNYEVSKLISCWGYESRKDGDEWDFDFCEECSDKIMSFINSIGGIKKEKTERMDE